MNRRAIAFFTGGLAGFTSLGVLLAAFSPAQAAQQLFCTGRMNSGWNYTAEYVDGRFTQIRWERPGVPPQVTNLSYVSNNAQGQPIYRGGFQAATAITLVDLSAGNVRPGSQISVSGEEWGWSRGNCGLSASAGGSGGSSGGSSTGSASWFPALRQDLMGVTTSRSREWMEANGFYFIQTTQHTNTQMVQRYNRDYDRAVVDVVTRNGRVADVVRVR